MANVFWKNLLPCFPLKPKPSESESSIPLLPTHDSDYYIHQPPAETAAAAVVLKNINSLCDFPSSSASTSNSLLTPSTDADFLSSDADFLSSDTDNDSPPDFATIFSCQRFFFPSPGQSNSIVESPDTRPRDSIETPPINGGVAVRKLSPDPYRDFRCSMQEMIEARNVRNIRSDWEFLHELLFCYLALNPKQTHRFIISAFTDILITFCSSPDSDSLRRPKGRRQ